MGSIENVVHTHTTYHGARGDQLWQN